MTDLPKMVPSAEERFDSTLDNGGQADHFLGISTIDRAFRDGVRAERERIMALLRNEELLRMVADVLGQRCGFLAKDVLSAIATKLGGKG